MDGTSRVNPLDDLKASLDEEESFAPAIRLAPGESVAGEVLRVSFRDGPHSRYPIWTIRTEDGSVLALHGLHKILVEDLGPAQPGDLIAVKYHGRVEKYHKWTCRLRPGPPQ